MKIRWRVLFGVEERNILKGLRTPGWLEGIDFPKIFYFCEKFIFARKYEEKKNAARSPLKGT